MVPPLRRMKRRPSKFVDTKNNNCRTVEELNNKAMAGQ